MIAKGIKTISYNDIFDYKSEFDILCHYFDIDNVPIVINSPFREDKNPSFGLFYNSSGRITYKDFATGDYGGTIDIFMKMWDLDYHQTICRIYLDLFKDTDEELVKIQKTKSQKVVKASSVELNVKIRKFRQYDLDFWLKGGLDEDWLRFGNVYPITHVFYKRDDKESVITADKYAYAYIENKDNIQSIKIYQPYSEMFKWISSHKDGVWDLWQQLPQNGDMLVISKSRKDALCIWKNIGIPSTSLQAEGNRPKPHIIDELKSRFKEIYLLYDNDFDKEINYGRNHGQSISNEFNLKQIEIPTNLKSKDPFDLYKKHGELVFKQTINNLIMSGV